MQVILPLIPWRQDPLLVEASGLLQVAADRGALQIWRWVSLPEGGQKFWLQWQLADTAWFACALVAATRSAAERPSNAPTQSNSLQRSHPHLNSIFASKLHALYPLPGTHFIEYSVLGQVWDRDAPHRPSTRNATRVKKGGRNYTFCPILMKNRGRNTTFSSFLLKYRGQNTIFSSFLLKYKGRNYTNFPETC